MPRLEEKVRVAVEDGNKHDLRGADGIARTPTRTRRRVRATRESAASRWKSRIASSGVHSWLARQAGGIRIVRLPVLELSLTISAVCK